LTDGLKVAVLPLTLNVPVTVAPSTALARVKLVVFSVELVIGSEKVAETDELSATAVAPLAGEVEDTVGGVVSGAAPVVKVQVKLLASGLPAMSSAAGVKVAVYCVLPARLFNGTNVAVLPLSETTPLTPAPPAAGLSVKLAVFSVDLIIASENVAEMVVFSPTPVSEFSGDVSETIGGVVSGINGRAETAGAATKGASAPPAPQPDRVMTIDMKDRPARIRAAIVVLGNIGLIP